MKIFEVLWCENKTAKTGKPYKALSIKDEEGKETSVNIFSDFPDFANIKPGSKIEGQLEQNGQYWNLKSATQTGKKPNIDRLMEKKSTQIAEAQNRKEQSISMAQDRTAWMWSKNNAVDVLTKEDSFNQETDMQRKVVLILELATEIFNGEPLKPF